MFGKIASFWVPTKYHIQILLKYHAQILAKYYIHMMSRVCSNCETQPPASIGWVALFSLIVCHSSFVPHPWHILSSPLYDVSDHTNNIFSVRIWSWQHVSVKICWVEPSLLLSSYLLYWGLTEYHIQISTGKISYQNTGKILLSNSGQILYPYTGRIS